MTAEAQENAEELQCGIKKDLLGFPAASAVSSPRTTHKKDGAPNLAGAPLQI